MSSAVNAGVIRAVSVIALSTRATWTGDHFESAAAWDAVIPRSKPVEGL
jgi:hypothetical protein